MTTIKPAAGPVMVTKEPLIRETNNPPIIAVKIPAIGGKPEAIAMPRQRGKAIKKTRNPDNKSARQFSFRPGMPVFGKAREGLDMFSLVNLWKFINKQRLRHVLVKVDF
jgi:hypothetical protein